MPASTKLLHYRKEMAILDRALDSPTGGIVIATNSDQAAKTLRFRLYHARAAYRQIRSEEETPYEDITIRIDGPVVHIAKGDSLGILSITDK